MNIGKKFFEKEAYVGLPGKGLKQTVASNAMHFYIPSSL